MTVFLVPHPNTQGLLEVRLSAIPFMPTKDVHLWLFPSVCQCGHSVLIQARKRGGLGARSTGSADAGV